MAEWDVTLDLSPGEVPLIQQAAMRSTIPPESYAIGHSERGEEETGAFFAVTVHADTEEEALAAAEAVFARLRNAASLPPSPARILAFYGPPLDPDRAERLHVKAATLLRDGRPELAVVVEQSACEVYVTAALKHLLEDHVPEWAGEYMVPRSVSLTEPRMRQLWTQLTTRNVETEDWWSRYLAHTKRRNAVVHEGAAVRASDAADSLNVGVTFRRYVDDATTDAESWPKD
jgi:hypothetical protein